MTGFSEFAAKTDGTMRILASKQNIDRAPDGALQHADLRIPRELGMQRLVLAAALLLAACQQMPALQDAITSAVSPAAQRRAEGDAFMPAATMRARSRSSARPSISSPPASPFASPSAAPTRFSTDASRRSLSSAG